MAGGGRCTVFGLWQRLPNGVDQAVRKIGRRAQHLLDHVERLVDHITASRPRRRAATGQRVIERFHETPYRVEHGLFALVDRVDDLLDDLVTALVRCRVAHSSLHVLRRPSGQHLPCSFSIIARDAPRGEGPP